MLRLRLSALAALLLVVPAGAAEVTYFQLPSGSYPHDVAAAADGTVWFTGQRQGFLGRFDPKSGHLERVKLGRGAAPHGVIIGPDGAPWVTEGGQNAIVRVDPQSREVKLFPLPKEFSWANLNTLTFDKNGVVWFTGQSGVYGRADPRSGKVEAWASPRGAGPYGITTTPSGEVWYASLAGDHIARIDVKTGAVTPVEPPFKGANPRRIWSDSHGKLWVSFWGRGGIGRYDPENKTWNAWAMPKSTVGVYSVYVDPKDKVWVTDWPANAIVRFDPVTERFDSFPSDRTAAHVRQMHGRVGAAWGGESGTDRLVVVKE
jgi:virginiamycin B lyase